MAAPMKPAEPTRSQQIRAKEDAIKRKLNVVNKASKLTATTALKKEVASRKKKRQYGIVTKNYSTQGIKGSKEGFTKSDYGVGAGAAIPYQIGSTKGSVSDVVMRPKPKPKTKPNTGIKSIWEDRKAAAILRRKNFK